MTIHHTQSVLWHTASGRTVPHRPFRRVRESQTAALLYYVLVLYAKERAKVTRQWLQNRLGVVFSSSRTIP